MRDVCRHRQGEARPSSLHQFPFLFGFRTSNQTEFAFFDRNGTNEKVTVNYVFYLELADLCMNFNQLNFKFSEKMEI